MTSLAVVLGALAALAGVTWILMGRARSAGPVLAVSQTARAAVHGTALGGPWILYDAGLLPAAGTEWGSVVALAAAWWLYALAVYLVGTGSGRCSTAGSAAG